MSPFQFLIMELFYYKSYLTYLLTGNTEILEEDKLENSEKINKNIESLMELFSGTNYNNIKNGFEELIESILKTNINNKKSKGYKNETVKTLLENAFYPEKLFNEN